ncbi:MAG TPA: hypothetical protein VGZ00_00045 [Candidatus Baltobacteraceae bacterium]|jgi:tetratricopeptide (TPR) repeat protein|nr:hypothetical protein [Candidatus Baltobacteraceae bacterium]
MSRERPEEAAAKIETSSKETEMVKRHDFLKAIMASHFPWDNLASYFVGASYTLADYGSSDFSTLRGILINDENLLGQRNTLKFVVDCIQRMRLRLLNTSGSHEIGLMRELANYNAFAAWLCQDAGEIALATPYIDEALNVARESGDPSVRANVLCRKAHLAIDAGDAKNGVALAQAAHKAGDGSNIRLQTYSLLLGAMGYSLSQDQKKFEHNLKEALKLKDKLPQQESGSHILGNFCTGSYIEVVTATCWLNFDPEYAMNLYEEALKAWPEKYKKISSFYYAKAAVAHIIGHNPEPEQAVNFANQSLQIAKETRCVRTLKELKRLDDQMITWRSMSAIAEFHTSLEQLVVPSIRGE